MNELFLIITALCADGCSTYVEDNELVVVSDAITQERIFTIDGIKIGVYPPDEDSDNSRALKTSI